MLIPMLFNASMIYVWGIMGETYDTIMCFQVILLVFKLSDIHIHNAVIYRNYLVLIDWVIDYIFFDRVNAEMII